jgi:phenylalanyl-tRNA synthetase beta subunit
LQARGRTLEDRDIDAVVADIVTALKQDIGAKLRD